MDLLRYTMETGITEVRAALQADHDGAQWERFLSAVSSGIDSVLDHETRFPEVSYADSEVDDCNSADEAGDLYEGYDDFGDD